MKEKLILVIGGSRSGKSEFAEKYVLRSASKCAYIATAEILDVEMENRVKRHQERRVGSRWITFEAPYEAEKAILEAGEKTDAILFDCITVYISNLLYGKNAPKTFDEKVVFVHNKIDELINAARKINKPVIFVTNDVGSGIVPDNAMAREYRDISGWVNQQIGNAADNVFYVVAGQAVDIKKLAFNLDTVGDENE
jgi:adenosylcobinamide kinase/adenosylcobinamide-phosphate guanylyltransferase